MALISENLLNSHIQEYLTLKQIAAPSDAIIPTFGRWMSVKYNWNNEELNAETDLNKAISFINEHYVQKSK